MFLFRIPQQCFVCSYLFYRAISVLLGEAWKSLSLEDREQYSQKAKVMADEQKKIHPDCWKRKRTVNSSSATSSTASSPSNKTTQQFTTSNNSEPQTSVVPSLPAGTSSLSSLGNKILPNSFLGNGSSSTNLVLSNINESKAGPNMLKLDASAGMNITVPK